MKCMKCNTINDENSKFCSNCGAPLNKVQVKAKKLQMTKRQLIFTLIAVIGIFVIGASIHYSNILMGEPTLVGHDFDGVITMNVPDESNFVIKDYRTQNTLSGFIGYINKGQYGHRISIVFITQADANILSGDIIEEYDNVKITKNYENFYNLYITKDNCQVMLSGEDLNLMKKMAETIEVKSLDLLQLQTTTVPRVN